MKQEHEIRYEEITLIVIGDYTPEEPTVMYDRDLGGDPGYPAEFVAREIYATDSEMNIIHLLSSNVLEFIEQKCLDKNE